MESFLPWLAVSAVLSNVDSHMGSPHNFYLYHDPDTDKFVFIPWDHNQSYGGALNASVDPSRGHELDLDQPWLGEKPLIQRVLAVPEHRRAFDDLVRGLLAGSLGEDRIDALQDLLAPHVARERAPYTLLLDPADFRAAADSTVAWAADGDPNSTVPGLLEFLEKRRAFLGTR